MWTGKPKSYEELKSAAAQHWADVAKTREAIFTAIHQDISNSPDVKAKPDPSIKWSAEGVVCPELNCGGTQFFVMRWVTVNGVRHRFEGRCVQCRVAHVYDWASSSWVG